MKRIALAALAGVAGSSEARPTDQTLTVFRDLSAQLDVQLAAMRRALDARLPAINNILKAAGEPQIVPRAVDVRMPPGEIVMDEDDPDDDDPDRH